MSMMDQRLQTVIKSHVGHCPKGKRNRMRFLALALGGECGELQNQVKKDWRDGTVGKRDKKIVSELVDVANYAFMLAETMGVDLPPAMLKKYLAVERRKAFKKYGRTPKRTTRKPRQRAEHHMSMPTKPYGKFD